MKMKVTNGIYSIENMNKIKNSIQYQECYEQT